MRTASLRLRLTAIILAPLLLISTAVGLWRVDQARDTARDLFDKALLSAALAIIIDVDRSDGDAISVETRDILKDSSGGPVFYHVYAPDGIFVTGYATPPVAPAGARPDREATPTYYTASWRGVPVRVLRIRDTTEIGGYAGSYTFTVWQDLRTRDAFVRGLARRGMTVIGVLIATVALVVWFGVAVGLRPLLDLEDAISRRSADDLSPIARPVPAETRGLVQRLNALFGKVRSEMEARARFLSDAAHQLRNPLAGVRAMAEAVRDAPDDRSRRLRAGELVASADAAADLAERLLKMERARAIAPPDTEIDLREVARAAAADHPGAPVALELPDAPMIARGDATMLKEAVTNLIDNALVHGGPGLSRVELGVAPVGDGFEISVDDDGAGIPEGWEERARARFAQVETGPGSGLGLAIADAVAASHGGAMRLLADPPGLKVILRIPGRRPAA